MEKKIKVAIAGFHNETAVAIARAVCESPDMELMKHGLSEPDFPNRHLQIACVYMELYNMERKPLFFENVKPDVIVDCFSPKDEQENMENMNLFVENNVRFVVVDEMNAEALKANIKNVLDEIRKVHLKHHVLKTA